jgi:hypothetical protein
MQHCTLQRFSLLAAMILTALTPATLLAADPPSTSAAPAAAVAPVVPQLQVADQFFLAIPKEGLGKDYLFSASLIPQGSPPPAMVWREKSSGSSCFPTAWTCMNPPRASW